MVLQQKSTAKVWGTADKGEKVKVAFRDKSATAVADDAGNWTVAIPTGKAGGPFEMTITGNNTIAYKNILVGEVWVCSGQSNMEWKLGGGDKTDKDYASAAPANPMLRIFNVTKNPQAPPQTQIADPKKNQLYGRWIEAEPKTINGFTAVGYFFGRNLQEDLKVPVGLIDNELGRHAHRDLDEQGRPRSLRRQGRRTEEHQRQ